MSIHDLSTVRERLDTAEALLDDAPDPASFHQTVIRDALRVLDAVDELLARLMVDTSVDPTTATRLGELRDDLAGHAVAAGAMTDVDVSRCVSGVLRRGMAAAKVAVAALDTKTHGRAFLPVSPAARLAGSPVTATMSVCPSTQAVAPSGLWATD